MITPQEFLEEERRELEARIDKELKEYIFNSRFTVEDLRARRRNEFEQWLKHTIRANKETYSRTLKEYNASFEEFKNVKSKTDIGQLRPENVFFLIQGTEGLVENLSFKWYELSSNVLAMETGLYEYSHHVKSSLYETYGFDITNLEEVVKQPRDTITSVLSSYPQLQKLDIPESTDLEGVDAFVSKLKENLRRKVKENKSSVRRIFKAVHESDHYLDESLIDWLLETKRSAKERIEKSADFRTVRARNIDEELWDCPCILETRYDDIRRFIKEINPSRDDIIYDLGCAFGKIVLYGALATEARYIGIELVPERLALGQAVKDRYNVHNAEFRLGNVRDINYSDGNIFYLFNPFSRETFAYVMQNLEDIARQKKITIASYGPSDYDVRRLNWLKLKPEAEARIAHVSIYQSK